MHKNYIVHIKHDLEVGPYSVLIIILVPIKYLVSILLEINVDHSKYPFTLNPISDVHGLLIFNNQFTTL